MGEEEKAGKELKAYKNEHKELDETILQLTKTSNYDQLKVQRLKRRKLWLKDKISALEEFLCDDIIA